MKLNLSRLSATVSLGTMLGLGAITPLSRPAIASNGFNDCGRYLEAAGLEADRIAYACGAALDPEELGECVLKIDYYTDISSSDALRGCFRVRQPEKLATCVVDISQYTPNPNQVAVLDFCRRSLLPERFSECVVGLTKAVEVSTDFAMSTCIAEGDFDRTLIPVE
jgi:hypothetical protein